MRKRPLTLKIWFPLTLITFLLTAFKDALPRYLTLPPNIPPELASAYLNAGLAFFIIYFFAALIVMYGVWIGNRIAYLVEYILIIIQMFGSLTGSLSIFWFYEGILQVTLLALSWKYFFE